MQKLSGQKIVGKLCFVDYQSTGIDILRNKASSEDSFLRQGKFLVLSVSHAAFALSNKVIFKG